MSSDPRLQPYFEANRANWDDRTPIHEASEGYDRPGFLRGDKPLTPVERAPLVAGKSLLHLQCHFGMDTLNLARMGARVTGLDLSPASIDAARRLSIESGIPGRFIDGNVYDVAELLGEQRFDVVYTGIGVLNWLPNIRAWAHVVAGLVAPGGLLFVYEVHPMLGTLDYERSDALEVKCPYFETDEPIASDEPYTYVDGPLLEHRRSYEL